MVMGAMTAQTTTNAREILEAIINIPAVLFGQTLINRSTDTKASSAPAPHEVA
jgi:hypothetical protein